ncbi:MAG TPA: ABC transporter substrate-binding protein [Dermatophilaceae bacterium]|nr:ABC transporter substrate-binding protein [Dermatophilaceae bacterium]
MRSSLMAGIPAVALLLAACGGGDSGSDSGGASGSGAGKAVVVGAIFDLSGATADVGTPYGEGVRGYVEWRNAKGGVEGRPLELKWQDYAYDVAKAEQLYSQFVSEGAVAFLGWGTGDSEALRTRVAADKIPFMSGSYSENLADVTKAPFNFVVAPTYSNQMVTALDQVKKDGGTSVAAFHNDSPFGESPLKAGEAKAKELGMGFSSFAMPKAATSFDAQLSSAKDASDIVVQNVASPAALLAKNVKAQGLDTKMSCLNWCTDELYVELAGPAAEGTKGVAPFAPPSVDVPGMTDPRDFLKSKNETLEKKGVHYVQGWYTAALMAAGIEKAVKDGGDPTGEQIRKALEEMPPFETGEVTPPIEFSAENHEGMQQAPLYQVRSGQWAKLAP